VQIQDGAKVDTLEDSHRTIYEIRLQNSRDIKRVSGIKRIGAKGSRGSWELLKLFGLKDQICVEMDSLEIV